VEGFENELEIEALNSLLRQNSSGHFNRFTTLIGSVAFMSDGNKKDLTYKIRLMDSKFITGKVFPDIETPGPGKRAFRYLI
jgi:hypothetical protein